ncbi:hypothetical protein STA3757_44150 [Stanieria sp. NIES-3757]|nr:hypothetical protein STA3757_44150 [Stanieria sp. NIES-3757]
MAKLVVQPKNSHPQWCFVPLNRRNDGNRQLYPLNTWVRLLELPNSWCDDEALLLCQHSDSEWVAWIPNYGEMILHHSQFCFEPQQSLS